MKLMWCLSLTLVTVLAAEEVDVNKLRANFNKVYTVKLERTTSWYSDHYNDEEKDDYIWDGPGNKFRGKGTTVLYHKRDATQGMFQEGVSATSVYAIEQTDANGILWRYHHMNHKTGRCEKYRKWTLGGVTWLDFNSQDKLVHHYAEGSKIYLKFYCYIYSSEDYSTYKRWWTTVYDQGTGSYMPLQKDVYSHNDNGYSISNTTYTPTTMKWVKLPCRD